MEKQGCPHMVLKKFGNVKKTSYICDVKIIMSILGLTNGNTKTIVKMKSKFEFKDNRPLGVKVKDYMHSLLFWKGRKKGVIHTRDIELDDVREIFFPKNFTEKYGYLGSVPYNPKSDIFKAILPLVLAMDYEAKPKWCPRWVLRFLHIFGNDKSIVRVRNRFLHNLSNKLTKGITFYDYKTKWQNYDLRDRKSTRLNSSHVSESRMPSSA